jgi:hypothetical protein
LLLQEYDCERFSHGPKQVVKIDRSNREEKEITQQFDKTSRQSNSKFLTMLLLLTKKKRNDLKV